MLRYTRNLLAEPHSSVGSVANLRTGGRWFDPRLGQYSFRGLMIVIATGFIPPAVRSFDNGYVGKHPEVWKEYCAEYWLKELQESMDRCTRHHDITENGVKHYTVDQSTKSWRKRTE